MIRVEDCILSIYVYKTKSGKLIELCTTCANKLRFDARYIVERLVIRRRQNDIT